MQEKKKSIRGVMNIAYIAAILMLQFVDFGSQVVFIDSIEGALTILAIALLSVVSFYRLSANKLKTTTLLLIIASLAIGVASAYVTSKSMILCLILIILSNYKRKIESAIKTDFWVKIICLIVVIALSGVGLTSADLQYRSDGLVRNSFGFRHPNTLGYIVMSIYCGYLALYDGKKKIAGNLAVFAVMFALSSLADSRTSMMALILLFAMSLLLRLVREKNIHLKKRTTYVLCILPLLLLAASISLTTYYHNGGNYSEKLDEAFSGRLHIQEYYAEKLPITLLGHPNSLFKRPLDNGYLRLLYNYGILGCAIALTAYIWCIKKATRMKERRYLIINVVLILYALMEFLPFRSVITMYSTLMLTDDKNGKK